MNQRNSPVTADLVTPAKEDLVTPAKAGVQESWVPAYAGMTNGVRACAGMTNGVRACAGVTKQRLEGLR